MLRDSFISILIKVVNSGLAFLLVVLLARLLGKEDYGVYAFAFSLATMLGVVAQLGLPQLLVRETSKRFARVQLRLVSNLWKWSGIFSIVVSIAILGVGWTALSMLGERVPAIYRHAFIPAFILVPLVTYSACLCAVLRGMGRIVWGQLPELVAKPLFFLLFILAATRLVDPVSSANAMWLYVTSAALALAMSLALVFLYTRKITFPRRQVTGVWPKWLYATLPIAMISGLQIANNQTDILILGFLVEPGDVGVYKVAVSLSALLALGLQGLNMAFAPRFSKFFSLGKMNELQNAVSTSSRIVLLIALPAGTVFLLFGGTLLKVMFGTDYMASETALKILVLGQLANAAFGLVGSLLIMTGQERYSLKALVIAVSTNVLLNVLLIPRFGINGAAVAHATSLLVWNLYMGAVAMSRLSIQPCLLLQPFTRFQSNLRTLEN